MSDDTLADSQRGRSAAIRVQVERIVDWRDAAAPLITCVVVGALALGTVFREGWWPHDDGSLAHSAQRVLAGELPHRDFVDLYTGLLTFVNAGLLAVFGENLVNLRIPLFALFLIFLASFYALARRVAGPWWALASTLFAVSWSVPVYPAPMPSWYLLFLTTIGTYAIVRYFESGNSWWVFAAGVCGGIGLAIKIVAVWFVGAAVLALIAAPLLMRSRTVEEDQVSPRRGALLAVAGAVMLALAVGVVAGRPTAGSVIGLLLPVAAVCVGVVLLGLRAWRAGRSDEPVALRGLAIFLLGTALPVVGLLVPYVATGSVEEFVTGVLVDPQSRYEFAFHDMPHPATILWSAPLVLTLWLRWRASSRSRLVIDLAGTLLLVFLAAWASERWSYAVLWNSTRALAPVIIVLGAIAMVRSEIAPESRRLLGLLVLVAGFATLLQFPFAAPLYFVYVAPLVCIAGLMTVKSLDALGGPIPAVLLAVLAFFGFKQLDHQSIESFGFGYEPRRAAVILDEERASIRVGRGERATYDRVLTLVAAHSRRGRLIFAGPDAPDIYFLSDSVNPTRSIMDFLDVSGMTRGSALIALLRRERIGLVVLNHAPEQSPPLEPETVRRIRAMYEHGQRVGTFEVRWAIRS